MRDASDIQCSLDFADERIEELEADCARLEEALAASVKRCAQAAQWEQLMAAALRDLDHATPRQRNGPCIRAADRLRRAFGLAPMALNGRPSEGLDAALPLTEGKADDN